ncbi:RNA-binding protein Nova-1-like protein [Leptotrombidium deliense]|uniref:RNA-binding protein Nova-1-like protein n=1 Tax=Leptotrombidium deliense TaxID=299467 RepID=A0A443SUW0_9ACAR|nr:RNA-binding protein Nova-1-like protein [Leptotrombidium deliense]
MSFSPSSAGQQGANGVCYHFKILVPAVAAGAIIGKGGETIAQLQKEAGARVKMSKANDFYPGTTERVCLISGSVEGILRIHEFIMEKIKEKPDPNAKMAIDFDHKQPAEREKQVKILVPNSTAGMIIGKGGSFIKQIKEESGAYVQISQKSRDHALAERCITVIGEMENNKKACAMIVSKIVEDPQSGSCLNVSYADVTGPVANFNPTGSPYANIGTSSGQSNVTNSNPSYSSNGSLNSLSPTLTNSFSSPQGTGTPGGMVQFSNVGLGPTIPPANSAQMIESIKAMLRVSGYSEDAVSEISSAMNTLANYGMLGLGLGLGSMFNSINGTPMIGSLGMSMASTPAPSNCGLAMGSVAAGQNAPLYTSQATAVPGLDACNNVATSSAVAAAAAAAAAGGGNGLFGPVGSAASGMSGISMNHGGFGSPPSNRATTSSDRLTMPDGTVFDPFRRSSPSLGSPGASSSGPMNLNNNSFGLGTVLNSPSALRKSPTPTDSQEAQTKVEIEIGDNIVGAILGHGGKSLVEIQRISGANIQISKKGIFVPGTRNRIVTITGTPNAVNTAQYLIEQQISEEEAKRARQNATTLSSVLR